MERLKQDKTPTRAFVVADARLQMKTIDASSCFKHRWFQFSKRGAAVTIAQTILREYGAMNDAQRDVVAHDVGPLLVIAGPGSGKDVRLGAADDESSYSGEG